MSEDQIPATVRRLTPQQRAAGGVWLEERRRNYPTARNRAARKEAKECLRKSGAYTTPPKSSQFKRNYTQQLVERNGRAQVVLVPREPSLMDRLLYASVHSTDSLILEMLTFIRDSGWLADPPRPQPAQ